MQPTASKMTKYEYPSLGRESVTSKASKATPKNYFCLPLFGHWFALEIYNIFHSSISSQDTITVGGFDICRKKLDLASTALRNACTITESAHTLDNVPGRGVMAHSGLRASEICWTAVCAEELTRFLFDTAGDRLGILLHQGPTGKAKSRSKTGKAPGNPDTADWYICRYFSGRLGEPIAAADGKLHSLERATKTSIHHSANCAVIRHKVEDWPVLLIFPATPGSASLDLQITVNKAMWRVPIIQSKIYNPMYLCSLYYAVHRLLTYNMNTLEPQKCNVPKLTPMEPLKDIAHKPHMVRVFKEGTKVVKYFDTRDVLTSSYCKINLDVIKGCEALSNVEELQITADGRIKALCYDFIAGNHTIETASIAHFKGALTTLKKLHKNGIVHGDIRLANIIFTNHTTYLIDFDLVGKVGQPYPEGYTSLVERHGEAVPNSPRLIKHDRYSIAFLMKLVDNSDELCSKVEDINVDLQEIISSM